MNTVIIDSRLPRSVKDSLSADGFGVIEMPSWDKLQVPVSAHPDMLMFITGDTIITHTDYYKKAKTVFRLIISLGYKVILSDESISEKYPDDILFNCVQLDNFVFGKKSHASKYILDYADKSDKSFIDVKQGYSKCSVAKVNECAAITADTSMYRAMTEHGIDTLLISQGNITLTGYDCGFIGGCSGSFGNKMYFTGNIDLHPDAAKIKEFCRKHGKNAVSLSNEPLFDGGSLFFI